MEDPRKTLADELDRLVEEGSDIYLAIDVLHGDKEVLDGVQKALADAGAIGLRAQRRVNRTPT
jgi:hypothetical protein